MNLYLMRHGDAENTRPDNQRKLSEKGRRDVINVATQLRDHRISPNQILTSPLLRARQTAFLVSYTTGLAQPEIWENLIPDGSISVAREFIASYSQSSLMLVTHMPLVDELTQDLTEISEPLFFNPGMLVHLKIRIRKGAHSAEIVQIFNPN
jgi:phosphohistidine phosphatase